MNEPQSSIPSRKPLVSSKICDYEFRIWQWKSFQCSKLWTNILKKTQKVDFVTPEVEDKNLKHGNWCRNTKDLLRKHVQIIAKIALYKTSKLGIWKQNSSSPVLPRERNGCYVAPISWLSPATKWELRSTHFGFSRAQGPRYMCVNALIAQTNMPSELGARRVCNTANFKRVTYIMCRRFLYRQTRNNFVYFLKGSMQVLFSSYPSAYNNNRRIALARLKELHRIHQ